MSRRSLRLRETQALLWRLISAPEGVSKALKGLSIEEGFPIQGDKKLSGAERLDIYANMYFFRIRDSLKEDFPAIVKLIGEDRFHNLITDYLFKHPSRHWSLRYAGERLPGFLKGWWPQREKYPFLSELARFEWALLNAFDAPGAEVVEEGDLRRLDPARWRGLILNLVPSGKILRFHFAVDQIREGLLKGHSPSGIVREGIDLIVWRKGLKVFYRRINRLERHLLEGMGQALPLGRLLKKVALRTRRGGMVAEVAALLKGWLGEGLLARS